MYLVIYACLVGITIIGFLNLLLSWIIILFDLWIIRSYYLIEKQTLVFANWIYISVKKKKKKNPDDYKSATHVQHVYYTYGEYFHRYQDGHLKHQMDIPLWRWFLQDVSSPKESGWKPGASDDNDASEKILGDTPGDHPPLYLKLPGEIISRAWFSPGAPGVHPDSPDLKHTHFQNVISV